MDLDDLEAEANLLMQEIDAGPENRHAFYLRLRETLMRMRAYGMPAPEDLARVEHELEHEFGGPVDGETADGPDLQAPPEVAAAIGEANAALMAAFRDGDLEKLGACYTEDGQFLPANAEPVSGRAAITERFAAMRKAGLGEVRLQTVELEAHGDTAIELGRSTVMRQGGEVADEGKYIVIWKRTADGWKLHRDMVSSNRPAAS